MRESDRCEFSEFSFGYAVIENAIHSKAWGSISGAPRFLSQNDEGNVGGGFDVELPFKALPLFLQFKIPQVVRRRSKKMPAHMATPYFRMHLRTKTENLSGQTQHEQMIQLERKYPFCVYYVTPRFSSSFDLDRFYLKKHVADESEWFSPMAIGNLSRAEHRVTYQPGIAEYEVRSDPRPETRGKYGFENIPRLVMSRLEQVPAKDPIEWIEKVTYRLAESTAARSGFMALPSSETYNLHWKAAIEEQDAQSDKIHRAPKARKNVRFRNRLRKLSMLAASRLGARLLVAFSQ